jgi:hypothetical protein
LLKITNKLFKKQIIFLGREEIKAIIEGHYSPNDLAPAPLLSFPHIEDPLSFRKIFGGNFPSAAKPQWSILGKTSVGFVIE